MSDVRQTSVQVPASAVQALDRFRAKRELSRDAAMRVLLAAHLERQAAVLAGDRLTHVSTLMRHPLRPLYEGAWPDLRSHLKMRLTADLIAAAQAAGLVLPGQTRGGGHADYRARPLTDSVVTAIAAEEQLSDEVLDGLRPCIRHQSAVGLWRLVVAATLTSEEQKLIEWHRGVPIYEGETRRRVTEILREGRSAWHDQFRFQVARFLVQRYLSLSDDQEGMLYDQRDGFEWSELRDNFEKYGLRDEDLDEFRPRWVLDLDGRGGANLWRIGRQVALEDLAEELLNDGRSGGGLAVEAHPPGWLLRSPSSWFAVPLPEFATVASRNEYDATHVLRLRTVNPEGKFVWPISGDRSGVWHTVAGIRSVVDAVGLRRGREGLAAGLLSAEIAELMLIVAEEDEDVPGLAAPMPVHIAHRAGLISDAEKGEIIRAARSDTQQNLYRFIEQMRSIGEAQRASDLEDLMDDPSRFFRLAFRDGLPVGLSNDISVAFVKPVLEFKFASIAQAIEDGLRDPAITWLSKWMLKKCRFILRDDRMREWQRSMDNNRHRRRFEGTESLQRHDDADAT